MRVPKLFTRCAQRTRGDGNASVSSRLHYGRIGPQQNQTFPTDATALQKGSSLDRIDLTFCYSVVMKCLSSIIPVPVFVPSPGSFPIMCSYCTVIIATKMTIGWEVPFEFETPLTTLTSQILILPSQELIAMQGNSCPQSPAWLQYDSSWPENKSYLYLHC